MLNFGMKFKMVISVEYFFPIYNFYRIASSSFFDLISIERWWTFRYSLDRWEIKNLAQIGFVIMPFRYNQFNIVTFRLMKS